MPTRRSILSQRLDEIVRIRVLLHPREWRNEGALMMNRWFDYRFTSPLALTLLFGQIYQEKLRAHIRRHVDIEKAETVHGTTTELPSQRAKSFTALWKARQRADEFFLPYDAYIEFCFDFSSRRKRRWTMLPSQLHPSPTNKEAWLECFDKFYEDRAPHLVRGAGAIPQYRLENDLGLPAQVEFRRIVLSELNYSSRPWSDQIAERVYAKRHLNLDSALDLVLAEDRAEVAARARSSFEDGAWPEEPLVKLAAVEQLPSCFGLNETISVTRSPCAACPLANKCADFGNRAMAFTEKMAGFASPVWESEKKRSARNTAAFRSRQVGAVEKDTCAGAA